MDALTGMCRNLIHARLVWTQEDRLNTGDDIITNEIERLYTTISRKEISLQAGSVLHIFVFQAEIASVENKWESTNGTMSDYHRMKRMLRARRFPAKDFSILLVGNLSCGFCRTN